MNNGVGQTFSITVNSKCWIHEMDTVCPAESLYWGLKLQMWLQQIQIKPGAHSIQTVLGLIVTYFKSA